MLFISIARNYFAWHYLQGFKELFHVWLNFLWFVVHFFSLPQLAQTLFSPWRRMTEERSGRFSFEDLAGYLIINIISRLIGAMFRLTILLSGLVSLTFVILVGILAYLFWLAAPVVIIGFIIFGCALFFSSLTL